MSKLRKLAGETVVYGASHMLARFLVFGLFVVQINPFTCFAQRNHDTIINVLLASSEPELGVSCLLLAKEAYPNLNTEKYEAVLNLMEKQLRFFESNQPIETPEQRIALMNTFLFKPGWWNNNVTFSYDQKDLKGERKSNRYLNGILDTRKGSCVTMPMLYAVLAQRLGWPVYLVLAPKHYFCRYEDPAIKENNIDATVWGGHVSNERFIEDAAIPEKPLKNGVYLKTLTNKEYLASLLVTQSRLYQESPTQPSQNIQKAIDLSNLALKYFPNHVSAHYNLATYYLLQNRQYKKLLQDSLRLIPQHVQKRLDDQVLDGMYFMNAPIKPVPETLMRDTSLTLAAKYKLVGNEMDEDALREDTRLFRDDMQQRLNAIEKDFMKKMEANYKKSQKHKAIIDSLGIVLDFTDTFYRKQAESIEKLKSKK